jgi:hypothetical protein
VYFVDRAPSPFDRTGIEIIADCQIL